VNGLRIILFHSIIVKYKLENLRSETVDRALFYSAVNIWDC